MFYNIINIMVTEENENFEEKTTNQDTSANGDENNEKTNENFNFNMNDIENYWKEFFFNIDRQIIKYRSMLMQIRGQSQLTDKKRKQEKMQIRKNIARLESMRTNPYSMMKLLKDVPKDNKVLEDALKQLEQLNAQNPESNEETQNLDTKA